MHKVLIVGAGRMGLRHATGALAVSGVDEVCLVDMTSESLENARQQLQASANGSKLTYLTVAEAATSTRNDFNICIIATTASNRFETVKLCLKLGAKFFLIEKTLGQSLKAVEELITFVSGSAEYAAVNLNMRQYESFRQLKSDLQAKAQLRGPKSITVNTGTIGIGANGIHYLDLLYYLLDANRAEVAAAEIEDNLIPSGRGAQFKDFGGWCLIKYFKGSEYLGRVYLSMSSTSTVFGGWDIVAPHGRITLDEIAQKRTDYMRMEESTAPVNRYAADYLPPVVSSIESPFLGDLTQKWIEGVINGERILPPIEDSRKVHELMFRWLSHSTAYQDVFPIT